MSEFFEGYVLGIETSCDETSASVIKGRQILSNVIASQADMHAKWGGVIPEVAARAHVEWMIPTLNSALEQAQIKKPDAIAITNRPGLVGALSVGVSTGKAMAKAWDIPFVFVHHLHGHLMSIYGDQELNEVIFPHLSLIVSGGHTELVEVSAPGSYIVLGETRDDAAGEAFDKGARLLGLGYPGGRAIQDSAEAGNPKAYRLPRSLKKDKLNFSFSGLKTATQRLVQELGTSISVPDASASLQSAIVDTLVEKTLYALDEGGYKALSVVGGVSANNLLRERFTQELERRNICLMVPPFELSTDNAAMVALSGSMQLARGERGKWIEDALANDSLETS